MGAAPVSIVTVARISTPKPASWLSVYAPYTVTMTIVGARAVSVSFPSSSEAESLSISYAAISSAGSAGSVCIASLSGVSGVVCTGVAAGVLTTGAGAAARVRAADVSTV